MAKKILFQDTSFRDGFQSVFGARVLTDDFLQAVRAASEAGIDHFEAGGGARFQALFLYCGESAFDMMDRFREAAGPDAKLQTLARGINVVALSAQPKDMIDLHARMFKKHGITHIRNFDALNDMRNLDFSGRAITKAGLHHQAVISMMNLPPGCEGAHDAKFYMKTLRTLLDSGIPFDSVCFKDASGTSHPQKVYETVLEARKLVGEDVLLWHHTHDTASLGVAQYKAAIEAGIDGICLARQPVSGGTSQPDLIAMWHALRDTGYSLEIDVAKILEANAVFEEALKGYFFPPEARAISPEVILSPMPGGALTANTMMMRDTGTLHLYPQVIKAMSECVARGGFGTSVTPVSQFYFQQAYANVTQGAWTRITDGYGKMVLGYFGRTPVKPDQEIVELASKQLNMPVFGGDPLDVIDDGIQKAKDLLIKEGLEATEENIFIVGALATPGGNKGLEFLKGHKPIGVRREQEQPKTQDISNKTPSGESAKAAPLSASAGVKEVYKVTVNGRAYDVAVESSTGEVSARDIATGSTVSAPPVGGSGNQEVVAAKLPGNVLQVIAREGQEVSQGEVLLVLEAMKMETNVTAPRSGLVLEVYVKQGQTVETGQHLVALE